RRLKPRSRSRLAPRRTEPIGPRPRILPRLQVVVARPRRPGIRRVIREVPSKAELDCWRAVARLVDFGWGFSAERFVRPHVVEVDEPPVAVALLRSTGARRRQLELGQVAAHALMAAIVLRLSGTRADQPDAKRHQPSGELRESAARPRANERRPVVALDPERSAVPGEKLPQ